MREIGWTAIVKLAANLAAVGSLIGCEANAPTPSGRVLLFAYPTTADSLSANVGAVERIAANQVTLYPLAWTFGVETSLPVEAFSSITPGPQDPTVCPTVPVGVYVHLSGFGHLAADRAFIVSAGVDRVVTPPDSTQLDGELASDNFSILNTLQADSRITNVTVLVSDCTFPVSGTRGGT